MLRMLLLMYFLSFYHSSILGLKFSVFLFVPFWLVFWIPNEDFIAVLFLLYFDSIFIVGPGVVFHDLSRLLSVIMCLSEMLFGNWGPESI